MILFRRHGAAYICHDISFIAVFHVPIEGRSCTAIFQKSKVNAAHGEYPPIAQHHRSSKPVVEVAHPYAAVVRLAALHPGPCPCASAFCNNLCASE
jgi:hypothetical protein